ncbi:uncharacterized protein [Rutidosis leptorrhynchoides]|uniref:uncharacterized protein n=1 Tax=Rutidosis leptorrhynchoides TaxID=125765 RepID=UPI003A99CA1B
MNKSARVKERVSTGGSLWEWTRTPLGRTRNELAEIEALIAPVPLDSSKPDSWRWSMSGNGIFMVKKLSFEIDLKTTGLTNGIFETMRNNYVPKKVEVFIWRAVKKRLPVLIELDKRGVNLNSVRCPICDDDLETVDHSLIFCKHVYDVWNRVYNWWNLGNFPTLTITEALNGGGISHATSKGKFLWQAVSWVCAYHIWKLRNDAVFKGKKWNVPVALNEIKIKSYEWISNRARGLNLDW